jgi:hypothetical protein
MKIPTTRRFWTSMLLGAGLLSLALTGCDGTSTPSDKAPAPAAVETQSATLSLETTRLEGGKVAVDLIYLPSASQVPPRMMELYLRHSAELSYVEASPLSALEVAHKQLIIQPERERLRVTAYASDNMNTLGAGPLARFVFEAPSGGKVSIENPGALFAPAGANAGITLGDAVDLGGAK